MDYIEIECKVNEENKIYVAIGQYVSFEVIENGYSSQVLIDRNDFEKLLPLLVKYYYKQHDYEKGI
jgi:hypothetical protein